MVKTLFKYEFKAYARTLLPLQAILIALSAVVRGIQFFESDSIGYNIVLASSVIALVISMVVLVIFGVIFSITRFYKNLFTHEGYLSFTLPVTTDQHLFAKLVMACAFTLISVLSIVISAMVAMSGPLLVEVLKAIGYGFSQLFEFTNGHSVWFIIELVIAALIAMINNYLIYYACISIGQTARKNRILVAFGAFFGWYFASQIISTIATVIINLVAYTQGWVNLFNWVEKHPYFTAHTFMCSLIAVSLILGCVYYLISSKIITKKLNLE